MTTHRNTLYILYIAHRKNIYGGGLALLVGLVLGRGLDGFHLAFTWEKPALLPGLARLTESPGLITLIFPQNPESDICVQVFIL